MNIKILEWDTKFFGFNVGQVFLNEISEIAPDIILKSLRENNLKLVYIFNLSLKKGISIQDDNQRNFLNALNAKLVDEKVIFIKLINNFVEKDLSIGSYLNGEGNLATLYKLALVSGQHSRFRLDERFSSGKFEDMYKIWVDNSINKKIADEIFVYCIDDKICGFITIKIANDLGKIGLLAVDPEYQGLSIGKKLIKFCEAYCFNNEVKYLEVATQFRNDGANNFYTKCGFDVKEIIEVYHLWT